ncbi:glycoside hydrolase family 2 protein [Vallitalea pronyensis]|uniref:Glycoside hydrolase family 2 protein n=1 Tax=Vallitalea pronyensis TaxID=1348613 RepID=A0A8J8SG07_9FIRM|nr:glycoside hydrolase family 2 TIM barrel-domain containing protein [Vallitalea pronyensis]QUI22121.1 glycoside hydrolase family 2 protein [Vallitalea pronyensis]
MRGIDFNKDWKFYLGEPEGAHLLDTPDSKWRDIRLPHDWSVGFSFDQERGEACTGFLTGGIGWYRKRFVTKKEMANQRVILNFDGMYNRAHIYCNGKLVTFHPYGYSPVLVDVTDYLNPVGNENILAVNIDHSRYADSRWYTGSGIYRKVTLHILPPIHIPVWGMSAFTERLDGDRAYMKGQTTLCNTRGVAESLLLKIAVTDDTQHRIVEQEYNVHLLKDETKEIPFEFEIDNPNLWDVYQGNTYNLSATLMINGQVVQEKSERFGVRMIHFSPDKGFFLNGKNTLIKGVCLHHDAGCVGAAVPKDVWRRRLKMLQSCGCNAIRTAHNPMSEDFLDLCDDMGFLVQEEFFDEWDNPKDKRRNNHERTVDYITRGYTEFFKAYAKSDLQNTVKRDINHPCIIQWSIGNEIEWTYPKYNHATGFFGDDGNRYRFWKTAPHKKEVIREKVSKIPEEQDDVGKTAAKLAQWTKDMDTTRPVIANCILPSVSYENGYIDALDMVGYSYRRVMYDDCHENYPSKPIMGTENKGQWHEWKAVLDKPFISGVFLWTGIDHMGEAWVEKPWPRKGSNLGLLDLAGFPKPPYHMFKSLWTDAPHIKMFTVPLEQSLYQLDDKGHLAYKPGESWERRSWAWQEVNDYWKYQEDEPVIVEIYSNCHEVELFLNGESLGVKYLKDVEDRIFKWLVPYAHGKLVAKGKTGQEVTETYLETTGPIKAILLETDRQNISCGADDVAHITLQLMDEKGNSVRDLHTQVTFTCTGPGILLGIDNGHPDNVSDFQSDTIVTSEGRCLLIVQGSNPGEIKVQAFAETLGIASNTVSMICHKETV